MEDYKLWKRRVSYDRDYMCSIIIMTFNHSPFFPLSRTLFPFFPTLLFFV